MNLVTPIVCCCSKSSLKQLGYNSLSDALSDPDNIYIDEKKFFVKGTFDSIYRNKHQGKCNNLAMYYHQLFNDQSMLPEIIKLSGKRIFCWCEGEKCHGQMIVNVFNSLKMISDVAIERLTR